MIGRIISAMSNRWCDVIIVTVWCNEEEDRKTVERNYEGGKFIVHYFEYEIADDMISLECKRGFALFRQMRLPNIWLKISFCINNVRREEGRSECIHLLFTCFALCNQHEWKYKTIKLILHWIGKIERDFSEMYKINRSKKKYIRTAKDKKLRSWNARWRFRLKNYIYIIFNHIYSIILISLGIIFMSIVGTSLWRCTVRLHVSAYYYYVLP